MGEDVGERRRTVGPGALYNYGRVEVRENGTDSGARVCSRMVDYFVNKVNYFVLPEICNLEKKCIWLRFSIQSLDPPMSVRQMYLPCLQEAFDAD